MAKRIELIRRYQPQRQTAVNGSTVRNDLLTQKEAIFVKEYCIDFNLSRATRAAGYSVASAAQQGCNLLRVERVQIAIHKELTGRYKRLEIDGDAIAQRYLTIATADVRELYKFGACRYCYGDGHRYHFTPDEWRRSVISHRLVQMKLPAADRRELDDQGGVGYNAVAEAHPECPECFGQGIPRPLDPKELSPAGAMIFDGIKINKDGSMEIKHLDRMRALEAFTEMTGLKTRTKKVTFNPDDIEDSELDDFLAMAQSRGLLPDLRTIEHEAGILIDGDAERVE